MAQRAGERAGSDYAHARYADTEHYAYIRGRGSKSGSLTHSVRARF